MMEINSGFSSQEKVKGDCLEKLSLLRLARSSIRPWAWCTFPDVRTFYYRNDRTHLQGKQCAGHLLVDGTSYPEKTGACFVVNGSRNSGAIPQQSKRCLLREFQAVSFAPGTTCEELTLSINEYWQVTAEILILTVDGLDVQLTPGDTTLLRTGAIRRLRCVETSQSVLDRE